jgi:YHS domain-containing protein
MFLLATAFGRPRLAVFGFAALIALLPLTPPAAFAFDETSPAAVNVEVSGLALRGHDPVAYFTDGRLAVGDAQYSAEYEGVIYHFADAENRDLFTMDPAPYLPASGGFCALGVAMGQKLDGDPSVWRIVDGTLYLNVNEQAQQHWQTNIPKNIAQADETWPGIKDVSPRDLLGR